MTSSGLTFLEKEPFMRLFNRGGYVLDFSTERFDDFTLESVGLRLCERYRISKGRSLEKFVSEAPVNQVWKLFSDLLNYYENFCIQEDTESNEYKNLYQRCKQIISSRTAKEIDGSMFFNVIIRQSEDTEISSSRVFENTDPSIAAKFKTSDGEINYHALRDLPTIMTLEYTDANPETAQIGYIDDSSSNGFPKLKSVITTFPSFTLSKMLNVTSNPYWGCRTHWMVFEGDPYKMLGCLQSATNNYNPVQHDAVLKFPDTPINSKQIAVMMPFNAVYPSPTDDPVYKAVKEATAQLGYDCKRVDEITAPTDIKQDILKLIEGSRIVVADLTGANPNVYYEMGLAHARGRIVIPISSDKGNLPFDNSHIRTIFYHKDDGYSLQGLTAKLVETLKAL